MKRGVRANIEMGAPLVDGRRYRLVIDPAWQDALGAALASGFDKAFAVRSADRESPDPTRWMVTAPPSRSREPLRVAFGEPLDHALATRMLSVEHDGRLVSGAVRLALADSLWTFTPSSPWEPGIYTVRVDARLEDLAGNSLARVFDADRERGAPGAEETDRAGASRTIEVRVR